MNVTLSWHLLYRAHTIITVATLPMSQPKRFRCAAARWVTALLLVALLAPAGACAETLRVQVKGVSGDLRDAVLAGVEANQYRGRSVSAAQARRLYERAEDQARAALEPYGFFNAGVDAELVEDADGYTAVLEVYRGEPVRVRSLSIDIGDGEVHRRVSTALGDFVPVVGSVLDQAAYEHSKAQLHAALVASGFLDAEAVTHEVRVDRAANSADIVLAWHIGPRYRFGATTFEGGQFRDGFLERYIPWREGDFYDQDKLLGLQQRLVGADYFAISEVRPQIDEAAQGVVPIFVMLAPAKRTVYTGGVFIGTDTGPGVRGGLQRRWVNQRGHKLSSDVMIAQRLTTALAIYQIPLGGPNEHSFNFGFQYRDENTETSESTTFRLAANDSRIWRGWNRIIGLHFLTGDFTVADVKGNTTLLYPEISLARKHADDPAFPRRGWSATFAARAGYDALVSETSFAQVTADAKWIRGLGDHGRFIARGSLGATEVDRFDKLPPELRFFAGGDRSIRGYTFQTIGPRDAEGHVVGGRYLAVASAEYEHYFKPNWGIATFVDAGDAFHGSDYRTQVGAGLGLRWRSPVGMVRVDLATPVRGDFDSGIELHIIIGPDL